MITLKLSIEMVQIIGRALGAQPYDAVAPVILELKKQIAQQGAEATPTVVKETE